MSGARAIEAYVAGRLSPRGRARVEAWLARSADARRLWARVRAYAALLEEAAAVDLRSSTSSGFERELFTRLAAARALDATLETTRELAAPQTTTSLEARTFASVAAARALGQVLSDARDDGPEVDAARMEAGLFAKLAALDVDPAVDTGSSEAHAAPAGLGNAERAGDPHDDARSARQEARPEAPADAARVNADAAALERARTRALATLHREADEAAKEASERARLDRVELPLRREVARLRARRRASVVGALALAAAALLLWWRAPAPTQPSASLDLDESTEPAVVLEAPRLAAEVTGLAGEARAEGRDAPLALGDPLDEDQLLEVSGALHARLAEGTGVVVSPGPATTARVRLARLRVDGIELALLEGRLSNEVRTGTPYVVEAGLYRVEVRGTRFAVDRQGDEISVRLDEGRVAIVREGVVLALLEAPAEWRSTPSLAIPEGAERPRALAEASLRWPAFRLPPGRFAELEVDGTLAPSADGLALRVPAGSHELVALDLEGRRHHGVVNVEEGFVLDERALTPERTGPRRGYLAPEAIRAVVAPRTRDLQRCYERTLRRTSPELAGSYTLRVVVGADGRVRRVRVVTEGETPPPFVACLQLEAQSWTFPRPEGDAPVTFDLPLAFHARGL